MKILKNKKRKAYIDAIMWILFIFTTSTIVALFFQGSRLFSSFPYYIKFNSIGWGLGFAFWLGHSLIGYYTEKKLDWTKNLKKANIISLSLYITYGIIVSITVSYMFGRFVLENTGESLFFDAFIKTLIILVLDLIFIAIYYSTYLTKYWKKAIEKNEELKRENLSAKYEALKNQVNPHFLFNSLNTLSGVVEQKPELATDFIKKLSDIYRYVLEQSDKELVSINDEMKFVEDFIFLSKMRFGDALIFNANITTNNTIQLVPLGLQMLVENAIKHNVIADDMPLKIEIGIEESFVIVKNNIQKKTTINLVKEPLGLENLKKRYAYLSGASVEVIESDSKFIVKLPIIEP
jgi:sensor histidine kinase YesM